MGKLKIIVSSAENLLAGDINGFSDPYVKIEGTFGSQKVNFKSKVIKKTLNPTWNQIFDLENVSINDLDSSSLKFSFYDWDALSQDDYLGQITLNSEKIKTIINSGGKYVENIKEGRGKFSGEIVGTEDLISKKIVKEEEFELPKKKSPSTAPKVVKEEEGFEMPKKKSTPVQKPLVKEEETFEMPKKRVVPEPKKEEVKKEESFEFPTKKETTETPELQKVDSKFKSVKKIVKKDIIEEEDKPKEKLITIDEERKLKKQFLSSKFRTLTHGTKDDDKELEEYLQDMGKKPSSSNFTTKDEDISNLFKKYDELGFGTLDSFSIRALLADLGFPMYKKYIDVIVRLMDEDGSDSIDYDEFSEWWHEMSKNGFETMVKRTERLYKIWELFCSADDDQSGFLEFEECKTLFPVLVEECQCRSKEFAGREITHQDVLKMMHEIDDNGDGRLSFPELVKLMNVFD